MEYSQNYVRLRGTLAELPRFSHENHGKRFYRFPLEVERLSGNVDVIPVLMEESVLCEMDLSGGNMLEVTGQIRTFNNHAAEGRKLVISVYAGALAACSGEPINEVLLTGAVCKAPTYRQTPLGREICDVMLAVNRTYHRADYIPCIFWGKLAAAVSRCPVGEHLQIGGRIQSRDYLKVIEQHTERRTAYEVSVMTGEICNETRENPST